MDSILSCFKVILSRSLFKILLGNLYDSNNGLTLGNSVSSGIFSRFLNKSTNSSKISIFLFGFACSTTSKA